MRVAALKQEEGSIGKTSRKPTRLATGNVSAGQVLNQAVQANKRTLVYSSKMLAESSEQALDLISQIMAKAVVSNAAHGIHAVTNFNPVNLEVVQTMHGEEAKVRQLYDNVEHDTRHVITKKQGSVHVRRIIYHNEWQPGGVKRGDQSMRRLLDDGSRRKI
jgi:hypothetical protein